MGGWVFLFYSASGDGVWTSRASLYEHAPRCSLIPNLALKHKAKQTHPNSNSGAGSIPPIRWRNIASSEQPSNALRRQINYRKANIRAANNPLLCSHQPSFSDNSNPISATKETRNTDWCAEFFLLLCKSVARWVWTSRASLYDSGARLQSLKNALWTSRCNETVNRAPPGSMSAARKRRHTASFCVSDRKIADNPSLFFATTCFALSVLYVLFQ